MRRKLSGLKEWAGYGEEAVLLTQNKNQWLAEDKGIECSFLTHRSVVPEHLIVFPSICAVVPESSDQAGFKGTLIHLAEGCGLIP
jgi:hypothetical protein